MHLSEYQRNAKKTDEKKRLALSMAGLVGETGSIIEIYKKALRLRHMYPGFTRELSEELGDTLWYIASIASMMRLKLEDIASYNLKKSRSLFDEGEVNRFDKGLSRDERLPRKFEVLFTERKVNKS